MYSLPRILLKYTMTDLNIVIITVFLCIGLVLLTAGVIIMYKCIYSSSIDEIETLNRLSSIQNIQTNETNEINV